MNVVRTNLTLGLLAGAVTMNALGNDLVTDRPDATESSSVIQPGYVQAELGWLYTDTGEEHANELPQTLIRVGLVERVELRLGWSGYANGSDASGVGDGELGTKIYLAEEKYGIVLIALLESTRCVRCASG